MTSSTTSARPDAPVTGLPDAGRRRAVVDPPGRHDHQPDRPPAPPDDDDPGQRPGILIPAGIKSAQARHEETRISALVRMMRADKVPAAAPEFTSLRFSHLHDSGHLGTG